MRSFQSVVCTAIALSLGLGACGKGAAASLDAAVTALPRLDAAVAAPMPDTGSTAHAASGSAAPTLDAGNTALPKPQAAGAAAPSFDAGNTTAAKPDAGTPNLDAALAASARDAQVDAAPKLTGKYVAMGSSFAAGPGIPDSVPGQSCGRSTRNYAHLVAAKLGLDLTDVSCSAATSDNIAITPQLGNPLQISAVTPDTRLVTITVGGNDVNYALSLTTCGLDGSTGRSCLGSGLGGDVNETTVNSLLDQIAAKLTTMLKAVQKAAPNARVYLVAYPMILPDTAVPCPPDVPMQAGDMMFLSQVGSKLQAAFSSAAMMAGVHFVDVYGPSRGHDACVPEAQRWIEGQATAGATAYHPNALGMSSQADLIVAEIDKSP